MVKINETGHVVRARGSNIISSSFLVRHSPDERNSQGYVPLGRLHLPKHMIGKKIRLKLEVVEEQGK